MKYLIRLEDTCSYMDRVKCSHWKDIYLVALRADRGVAKDMQAWTIATGVPAKVVRSVEA